MAAVDDLVAGRDAYARGAWAAARDGLGRVDPATLRAGDLRALGTAAYLIGDRDLTIRSLQRAHALSVAAGEHRAAARDAHEMAMILAASGEPAVAAGWVARARRLIEDEPEDALERGYLLIHDMFRCADAGDVAGMTRCCNLIEQIGRKQGDADLVTFAISSAGRALLYGGGVSRRVRAASTRRWSRSQPGRCRRSWRGTSTAA